MDLLRQLGETISSGVEKAKSAVAGDTVTPVTVTDGYPVGARRRRRGKKTKKTKGGKSRRKTARRV